MRLTPEKEKEIRDLTERNYEPSVKTAKLLLAEIDALRASIKELSEMNSNGCDLLAAAYEERNRFRKVVDAARAISAFREEPYPGLYTSVLTSEAKMLWEALRELDGTD